MIGGTEGGAPGGHPAQGTLLTGRAVFTEACPSSLPATTVRLESHPSTAKDAAMMDQFSHRMSSNASSPPEVGAGPKGP
jgi:hypothetical protein